MICTRCGSALAPTGYGYPAGPPGYPGYLAHPGYAPKEKSVAILLAVFLAFWTWLYTYKADSTKFWVGLGVDVVFGVLGLGFAPFFLVNAGIWIWAIADTASKPDAFYRSGMV